MTTRILCLLYLLAPMAWAETKCTLKVDRVVLHYYDDNPNVIAVEAAFRFHTNSSSIFRECLIYSASFPLGNGGYDRYPLFRVNGPVPIKGKHWGHGRLETFDFQSQPLPVVGPRFEFSNTLAFPVDAAQRRGELEMTIEYQWVGNKGLADAQQLQMVVAYDLDSRKSKKYREKPLTAKEIVLMPVTVPYNLLKLILCGLEC